VFHLGYRRGDKKRDKIPRRVIKHDRSLMLMNGRRAAVADRRSERPFCLKHTPRHKDLLLLHNILLHPLYHETTTKPPRHHDNRRQPLHSLKPTMTTSRTKPTLDSLPNEILKGVYESLDDFESVIQLACTSRALGAIYQENRWPILRANLSSHPAMRDGGFYNGFKLHKLLYPSKQSRYTHSQWSRASC
jgi:hypothetical protein